MNKIHEFVQMFVATTPPLRVHLVLLGRCTRSAAGPIGRMDGDSPGIVGIVPQHESDASTRHMPRLAYLFYGCHCLMHAWRLRPEKERRRRGRLGVHGRIFRSIEPPRRAAERPPKATTERGTRRRRRFASSFFKGQSVAAKVRQRMATDLYVTLFFFRELTLY